LCISTLAPLHGWLILDKPVGLGSTQAVAAVKRMLRVAGHPKARVGHGGTLDPLASGVLPIAIGEATKLSGRMLDADKIYDFTLGFGIETSTLDAEGSAVATSDVRPSREAIARILPRFTGPIRQTPPAFSALKIDGKRAYDLARAGEEVVLAERAVTINALDLIDWTADAVTLSAAVSKGTYIRSLARDIAHALGSVGHVKMLRRTKAGPFTLKNALSLDILEEAAKGARLQALLLPLTDGLVDIPVLSLTPEQAQALRQGRRLIGIAAPSGLNLALLGDTPVALVEVAADIKVVRGFNLMSE
jgi:tRNA pseudouridine55 synthase